MTLADFDAAGAAVLAWLLTYAIHSTILLAAAALAAWRFADHYAWLDVIWKTALVGPIVTATLLMTADVVPLGGRWSMPVVSPVTAPGAAPAQIVDARIAPAVQREAVAPPLLDRARATKSAQATTPDAGPGRWQVVVRAWPAIAVIAWLAIGAFGVARYAARRRIQPNRNAPLRSMLEGRSRTVVSCQISVAKRGQVAVSDRGTLGGLTQFLTQFDVLGSATGP